MEKTGRMPGGGWKEGEARRGGVTNCKTHPRGKWASWDALVTGVSPAPKATGLFGWQLAATEQGVKVPATPLASEGRAGMQGYGTVAMT